MKTCGKTNQQLTAFVLGYLSEEQVSDVTRHLVECEDCRVEVRELGKLLECAREISEVSADEQMCNSAKDTILVAAEAIDKPSRRPTIKMQNIRRIIMKSRISKFAAAAVIIMAVVVAIGVFDKSISTAYAIEQTIEATRGLRFIHLKCEPAGTGVEEIWAQFDDKRELLRLRMNFPNTMDGPKDVVWQEGKAEAWFKAKKGILVVREENMLAQMKMSYKSLDPKLIGEQLYHAQADEKKQIEIQESRSKDEPITITWTRNGFRTVYKVNPETKLLQQLETYELKDEKYKFLGRTRYLDYNQPIDPAMFTFNDVPADVIRVDQTTQQVGLAQGDLSDEEVAVKVARQFFEALIAEDYDKAGKMLQGIPGKKIQQMFGDKKFLRIISIGDAAPHPRPERATKRLVVPCVVEIEKNGQVSEWKLDELGIRQVYKQPGRWSIFGGIEVDEQ